MLERTLAVLAARSQFGEDCADVQQAIKHALAQPPVPPPTPVDSRVDLLALELSVVQTQKVLVALEDTAQVELDELQARRVNPWGGFREAWLEHYNQVRNRAGAESDGGHTG